MTKPFGLSIALNNLSFGSVSIAILREIFARGLTPSVFPIGGQVDLSAQKPDADFNQKLTIAVNDAPRVFSRGQEVIKLWHINQSIESYSNKGNNLITFHEVDQIGPYEINILKNQNKVYVTTKFTQDVFKTYGIESIYFPLGFDSHNFHTLEKRPKIEGVTSWGMFGKWEDCRKSHGQMLRLWVKKYGNNMKHRLNLSVTNPFLKPDQQNALISQALEGKQVSNLNFLPFVQTNAEFNSVLQASDITLSCGAGEGRDLPCYHATALGAWPIAMRAHAYLDYLDDSNAILVHPNGKKVANDNIFFFNGKTPYNNGNFFTFSDEDFVAAMETAEKRAAQGLNIKGMELQKLTYKDTVDVLLKDLV